MLMGVDRGKLKDLLMMDMLSTTIGIKAFKHRRSSFSLSNETVDLPLGSDTFDPVMLPQRANSSVSAISLHSTSTDYYDVASDMFFEPILYQGERLPVKRIKTFQLDDVTKNLVTVEVFEEVEVEVSGETFTKKELRSMGCFDFIVPNRDSRFDKDAVDVSFYMDECGRLAVSLVDDSDKNNNSSDASGVLELGRLMIDFAFCCTQ